MELKHNRARLSNYSNHSHVQDRQQRLNYTRIHIVKIGFYHGNKEIRLLGCHFKVFVWLFLLFLVNIEI